MAYLSVYSFSIFRNAMEMTRLSFFQCHYLPPFKQNCKKVNAEFVWSEKKKIPSPWKQDAILEALLFLVQLLRVCWWTSQPPWFGWSRDKSHSSGWSDSAVFGSPFYTRPLLIAENNECKMNLAMKISHFVRYSVLCHQGRNWIFHYFSNFLSTKYSGVLNKYLLNGTSPVLKNGNLSSLDSTLIPFNSV